VLIIDSLPCKSSWLALWLLAVWEQIEQALPSLFLLSSGALSVAAGC